MREWVHNQAAAKLIDTDDDGVTFRSRPRRSPCSPTPSHPAFGMGMFGRFPTFMDLLKGLPESFRTGVGHDYDAHGPDGAAGIERSFEPWYRNFLVPVALPSARRRGGQAGGRRDRGRRRLRGRRRPCASWPGPFPTARFHGYDISQHALIRAEQQRADEGARPTPASTTSARSRCPPTTRSTSSPRSTASTT